MKVLGLIWEISLYASVLGFWPAMILIFSVWDHYDSDKEVPAPHQRIREWFPVIVYPWAVSVGIFLAIFVYVAFFSPLK